MIRDAKFTDIKPLVRLCESIRGRSHFSGMCQELDPGHVKGVMIDALLRADNGAVKFLVSEVNGELNGMFVGTMSKLYELMNVNFAACLIWYVDEAASPVTAMRLARRFTEWAEQADGPLVIRLGLTDAIDEPEAAARSLEKLEGFRRAGIVMEKERR